MFPGGRKSPVTSDVEWVKRHYRSSRSQMLFKTGVLKNLSNFTGKQIPMLEPLLNKVTGLKACNFIKKRLQHRCLFSCKICEIFQNTMFYRTPPVLQNTTYIPAGIYLLKVNNRNTRTRCEICSKLTIKTPERRLASFWCLYC